MAARRSRCESRGRAVLALLGAAALGASALVGGIAAQPRPIDPRTKASEGRTETPPAKDSRGTRAAPAAPDPSAPPNGSTGERREAPLIDDPKPDAERARVSAALPVPQTGPGPRIDIPLADGVPTGRLAPGDLPPAWTLKRFAGRAQFELARDNGRPAFRLSSQASSFALHRDVAIDVQQFPILTWAWKVVRLPARGDVRDARANDQAAQVYVIFPRSPSPRTASDVLGYVWDTQAPAGHREANPSWPNVRVIVLESGAERLGTWVREQRNVRQDYRELFKKEPPAVGRVAVMTDSDQTRTVTEALFSDLAFQRVGATSAPEPTHRN